MPDLCRIAWNWIFLQNKKIWGIVEVFLGICLIISVGRENYITNNERVTAYASGEK